MVAFSGSTAGSGDPLADRHGRRHRKLRVSVTDRCQLRCRYCMPEGPSGGAWLPKGELLSFEEIARFVSWAAGHGVDEVRITGGEPLLRRDLDRLIRVLGEIKGIRRIALTTNGLKLDEHIDALAAAGLDAVTISVDSLDAERFRRLTGSRLLADTLRGVHALAATPCIKVRKLNAVVLRGENDNEIPALIEFAAGLGMEMRFIEFMPFGEAWSPAAQVPMHEIVARVAAAFGPTEPIEVPRGSTSRRWRVPALGGATFGVIPTVSEPLCSECDRLRLTADGRVLHCLFDARGVGVRDALRTGDEQLLNTLVGAHFAAKGPGFLAERHTKVLPLSHMHRVGG
jgi:cyclic pyranopterin phosphate synthase